MRDFLEQPDILLIHETGNGILRARHVTDGFLQNHNHDLVELRILGAGGIDTPSTTDSVEGILHEQ